jgi:hypothetical protein
VDFFDPNGKVLGQLGSPPSVPVGISAAKKPRSIRVTFNQGVRASSVTTAQAAGNAAVASFLVERENPLTPIPGTIHALAANVAEFTVAADAFVKGVYRVTLFGDVDTHKLRPAITSIAGARLDGEPLALPSGNGVEGGNFVFQLEVL